MRRNLAETLYFSKPALSQEKSSTLVIFLLTKSSGFVILCLSAGHHERSRRFPTESLADELMRRFRVNYFEALAEDMLRGVLAACA